MSKKITSVDETIKSHYQWLRENAVRKYVGKKKTEKLKRLEKSFSEDIDEVRKPNND